MDQKLVMTLAVRMLKEYRIHFDSHFYKYEEKGGTTVSSRELGISENQIVKTLIMETETKSPLIVLMHGDLMVSTKNLARLMNVKTVSPCGPDIANKHSGYMVGGTSPFGTKKKMPVYMQESILQLEKVFINGGKRGYLISLSPQDIVKVLSPHLVDIKA